MRYQSATPFFIRASRSASNMRAPFRPPESRALEVRTSVVAEETRRVSLASSRPHQPRSSARRRGGGESSVRLAEELSTT
eukprot:5156115-Prymnesium_polylepis.1